MADRRDDDVPTDDSLVPSAAVVDQTDDRSEPQEELPKGLLVGNPKLQILLIAGVFYAILIAMCLFVGILVFRG